MTNLHHNTNLKKDEIIYLLSFQNQVTLIIPTDLHVKDDQPPAITLIVALTGILLIPLRGRRGLSYPIFQDEQGLVRGGHIGKETSCTDGEEDPNPPAIKDELPFNYTTERPDFSTRGAWWSGRC